MQHLRALISQLHGRRVVVIGDIMLDEYVRGDVTRISPEAPVPVLEVRSHDWRLGGAANAANGIQALGGVATLVGVVGRDETATTLGALLAAQHIGHQLVSDSTRPTSKKTRLVAQQQQIVRIDQESRAPLSGQGAADMKAAIDRALDGAAACVLSDYAKGVVTADIAKHAINTARAAGLPVIVDPKQRDFSVYRGATVITPNLHELEAASHALTVGNFEVERSARAILPVVAGAALLVTRSADGMSLYRPDLAPLHVPALAKEVFDVTGAGDTVVATLALALGAGIAIEQAIELASVAAAIAVSKRGTSTVSPDELAAALHDQ
jgi:rfaE bifunctional protein kinase chain/domain